jgi:nucleoside phosphorylase
LISDQVIDYETQKITEAGPEIRWTIRLADPRLLGAARNLPMTKVLSRVVAPRPIAGQPSRHVGPIATGDKIIAATELLHQHGQVWTKLLGVEMEAGGVAPAAHESPVKPGFFMVRAVSDLADELKNSPTTALWRPYACDLSAAFAMSLLESGPVPAR